MLNFKDLYHHDFFDKKKKNYTRQKFYEYTKKFTKNKKEIYQAKYLFHVGAVSNFIRDFKNARILWRKTILACCHDITSLR